MTHKTTIVRLRAPPPNNIYSSAHHGHCASTTPLVAMSIYHFPPSEGSPNGNRIEGGGSGKPGHTRHTISLKVDGNTFPSTFELNILPSNIAQGEEVLKRNGGRGEYPCKKMDPSKGLVIFVVDNITISTNNVFSYTC